MPTVVIAAYNVAGFPEGGGHLWVYLQYVLGLRQLGCEVYWLEAFRTKGRVEEESAALATFRARMKQYGLDGNCIFYLIQSKRPSPEAPAEYLNMTRDEAEAIVARADLLLNFHYRISPGLLTRFLCTTLADTAQRLPHSLHSVLPITHQRHVPSSPLAAHVRQE